MKALAALQVLSDDGERVLCRGWRSEGNTSARLAVLPVAEHPAPASLDRLAHEYGLREELDSDWAVRPLDLVRECDGTVLVLEDPGGQPLDRVLGAPMETGKLLRLAIGIAAALGKAHQRGLVHKDVKPANILVNPDSGEVWLTGFGLASRLARERQRPEPPESIAGTLAYMAPEQTGRMNRSIDSRSDLYALGVTLYEMLSGNLPFAASDPMEWVHCHIARQPAPPAEQREDVPGIVSAIIMKLLAKTPEERYQTAAGVERDLRRCLSAWKAERRINNFPLGENDIPDRLLLPEKLYGRSRDVELLLATFNRVVADDRPELVLVSGYSGIGKSSVVNELHKSLVPPRGLFASGKFDQYKRDIPYSTLAQAFQGLIRALLSKTAGELNEWRDALHDALGPNGKLIVNLVPELQLIIGQPPPVPDLPLQDAQRRFQLVFRRFIGVFARPEHPLALFLDDLQWLDSATLDLIEDLLTQSDVRHLMLIGAYRDNEVNSSHPLMRTLEAIRAVGAPVQEIVLAPLTREDLAQLTRDALHCEPERATPLAELIHEKTAGNPFFAIQFISALVEESLLTFDYGEGRWSWDLDRIRAKGYTDNVVDLMVGKLNRLPVNTQKALRQLACLGNNAESALLAMVYGSSEEELHTDLQEALRTELVLYSEGGYRFLHDRVQEAAYSLVPADLRKEAHLRIGRLLLAHTSPEKREEAVFEIVNQFNRGTTLIGSRDERDQLAELNLIAGKRAKASTAYVSALSYFIAGTVLLADDRWERRPELIFQLELNRAECEFLTGELPAAEARLTMLSSRAANIGDEATVACLRVDLYTRLNRSDRAVAVCLGYLRHVGIHWSPHPTEEETRAEYERIWSLLGNREIEKLVDLPLMSDPTFLATLDVLSKMETPALFAYVNLYSLIICRSVNLSLEHGNTDASCKAYARLGMIAGPRFGNYKAGSRFGQLGYDLVEKRGLDRFQAHTYLYFGVLVMPWTKHVRTVRDLIQRVFNTGTRIGDLTIAAFSRNDLITNLLAVGDPLDDAQREAEQGLEFAQKARFGFVIDVISSQLALIRTLRGFTTQFGCLNDERFDELRFERRLSSEPMALVESWYWVRKLQARFFAGDYVSAIEASSNAQRLLWTPHFEKAEAHFYGALSHAAHCHAALPAERRQHVEALAAHYRQLVEWAENCPENFANRAALVGAELARIEGRDADAMRLYEQAIRSAHANGFVHNEAIAYEVAARFYAARGFHKFADAYLREARYCYLRWGAGGKVRQLDEQYPRLREEEPAPDSRAVIGEPVERLELATVLKVSQAVSGEIVLERVVETLLRTAIEHAGAERGLLILLHGSELWIQAEAKTRGSSVTVRLRETPVSVLELPESIVRYAARTQETVILDDAAAQNPFSSDEYIREQRPRSVLCLPLVKQGVLVALLYLENNLGPNFFAPGRIAVLKVLASQAAISLDNSRLYREVQEREAEIRRLVDANIVGIFIWELEGRILEANDAFLRIVGYEREDLLSGPLRWTDLTPAEWLDRDLEQFVPQLKLTGSLQPFEKEFFRKDGSRVPVLLGVAAFGEERKRGVAFVVDLTERKQAEEALRRSEFYLAEGQRLGHAGSWSFKPDGTCDYWSRELYDILGFDPKNGIPTISDYFARVHPEDRAMVEATIQRMIAAGEGCDLKKRIIRPDGVQRVIRCVGMPVRENGAVTRFVGTMMDITEQEELTQELRRREAYLAEAQRLSHTGSFGWDVVTGERTWSEENYRILGYDRSIKPSFELVRDRVHPDDLQVWQQAFGRAAEGKEVDFEHRLVMPDGSVKHLHVVACGVQRDGKYVELVGTSMDITEQKQSEDRLRRSERNLAEGQRLTKTGSWILDYKTGNTDWSVETCRIFGFPDPPPSPHYSEFRARVRLEDRESVDRALRESFETGEPRPLEYVFVLPNGVRKSIETISQPVRDKTGTVVRLMGTVMDVTERKQAQEAIRRSEAFLAEGQRLSRTGTWGWNASTGKVTWSQEHFRILGLDPQDTNPSLDVFWERVHPDDRIGARHTFESAIRDKRDFEQEFRIVTPDWSIRHLHGVGHAILTKANELMEFIGSTMDITERKRAEERAQSQREAIRLALNAFVEKLDVNHLLDDVIAELNKQFHANSWELWLFDEAIGVLLLHSSSHPGGSFSPAVGSKNAQPLRGDWQRRDAARAPQILQLPAQESSLNHRPCETLKARGIKTLMIVPLVLGEQNLGFLELHFQSPTQFTSDDLELAQALVNHATLALQLNRLTRRAEQLAVTEERNRLAREIHDTLAQAFAGIVLHGEVLSSSLGVNQLRTKRALSQMQKLARSGLEEARRSVQALRPKALDGTALPEALRQAAIRLNDDAKLSCQFRQRGKQIHLSDATQNELFRIGQEALTNVVKHAQAKSVCITLVSQARRVTLSIKDDGIGFATAKPQDQNHGFGMGTMRERAQGIGGRFRVESRPGGGTTIRVEVPSPANRSKRKVNQ